MFLPFVPQAVVLFLLSLNAEMNICLLLFRCYNRRCTEKNCNLSSKNQGKNWQRRQWCSEGTVFYQSYNRFIYQNMEKELYFMSWLLPLHGEIEMKLSWFPWSSTLPEMLDNFISWSLVLGEHGWMAFRQELSEELWSLCVKNSGSHSKKMFAKPQPLWLQEVVNVLTLQNSTDLQTSPTFTQNLLS